MIIDGHVAIAKETCRVIDMGTQFLTTEDIPAHEADTLGDRFGELVESCNRFPGVHPEHNFQIVQVEGAQPGRARPGGSTGRLDRELHQGPQLESSTGRREGGGLVWGLSARTLPRQCVRISSFLYLRVGLQCCKNVRDFVLLLAVDCGWPCTPVSFIF